MRTYETYIETEPGMGMLYTVKANSKKEAKEIFKTVGKVISPIANSKKEHVCPCCMEKLVGVTDEDLESWHGDAAAEMDVRDVMCQDCLELYGHMFVTEL